MPEKFVLVQLVTGYVIQQLVQTTITQKELVAVHHVQAEQRVNSEPELSILTEDKRGTAGQAGVPPQLGI